MSIESTFAKVAHVVRLPMDETQQYIHITLLVWRNAYSQSHPLTFSFTKSLWAFGSSRQSVITEHIWKKQMFATHFTNGLSQHRSQSVIHMNGRSTWKPATSWHSILITRPGGTPCRARHNGRTFTIKSIEMFRDTHVSRKLIFASQLLRYCCHTKLAAARASKSPCHLGMKRVPWTIVDGRY